MHTRRHINGFGLLQAVQHYPKRGVGKTISVNFLHFTMQEYFSALYVSTLPSQNQLLLMKKRFWDGQFNFMWMMYVGIIAVKSNIFRSFIGGNDFVSDDSDSLSVINRNDIAYKRYFGDNRKCLNLFLCYMEAKSDTEMPKAILSIFTEGNIILNGLTLLPHNISSLIFYVCFGHTTMEDSTTM